MTNDRKRVLIVDDIRKVAEGIGDLLAQFYDVEIAQDALEAKAHFSTKTFDVAILDVNLASGINGLELAQYLRSRHEELCIIVISAIDCGIDTRQKVASLGGYFLEKTVQLAELRDYIEKDDR